MYVVMEKIKKTTTQGARSTTYKLRLRIGDKGNTVRYEPMMTYRRALCEVT